MVSTFCYIYTCVVFCHSCCDSSLFIYRQGMLMIWYWMLLLQHYYIGLFLSYMRSFLWQTLVHLIISLGFRLLGILLGHFCHNRSILLSFLSELTWFDVILAPVGTKSKLGADRTLSLIRPYIVVLREHFNILPLYVLISPLPSIALVSSCMLRPPRTGLQSRGFSDISLAQFLMA